MLDTRTMKSALAYGGTTQKEIAEAIGMSPANFSDKLRRGTLGDEYMHKIAKALGAVYVPASLVFPDGQKFQ